MVTTGLSLARAAETTTNVAFAVNKAAGGTGGTNGNGDTWAKLVIEAVKLYFSLMGAVDKGHGVYLSMTWPFPGIFIPTAVLPQPPSAPPRVHEVPKLQEGWTHCERCSGLYFGQNATKGVCPAGGTHAITGGNYVLVLDSPDAPGQPAWRWCQKCEGLFFSNVPHTACPQGGSHDGSASANYTMPFQTVLADPHFQPDWKWCVGCSGMFFNGHPTKGKCPNVAAGGHVVQIGTVASGDYWVYLTS